MASDPHILVGRSGCVAVLELGSDIVEHAQAQGLIKIEGPDRTILVAGRRHVLCDDTMVLLRARRAGTRFFVHHLGSTPRAYRHGVQLFAN